MKFKSWKKLSYRQKQPTSEAQYNYIRTVGQYTEVLAPFRTLPWYMRTNNIDTVNKPLQDYLATQLSDLDVPYYNELTYKQKYSKKAYYECMVEALTGAGETFRIYGIIDDGDLGIGGAECTVDDETVVTDENGNYEFTGILPGVYTLKVSAEHYTPKKSQVTVSNADVYRYLSLDLCEFTVSGIVSDDQETPAPVTGAVVKLNGEEFTTESDGAFEFTFVPKGEHSITVSAEGFDDEETTVTVSNADVTKNITLTTAEE